MYSLAVTLNGTMLCHAGISGASAVSVVIAASLFGEEPASFYVAGMQELEGDRLAHVYWVEESPLQFGDVLALTPTDISTPSTPHVVKPTDSPEYLEEQTQYDEFLAAHIWPQPKPVERRQSVAYGLSAPAFPSIEARLSPIHQHLLCSIHWNKWRPERTRVSARSFASADIDSKVEWLQTYLRFGESLSVDVRA
jgi:hypothetical protein